MGSSYGSPVKFFRAFIYTSFYTDPETGLLDYDKIQEIATREQPN
jgi:glycine hydroxymethyltransferase